MTGLLLKKSVYILMKSMEQTPGFGAAQKVMKGDALQNISIRKRQACFKKADIRILF